MAVLVDGDRSEIWARLMRDFSALDFGSCAITKQDLRAGINATDDWIDANAAAFNLALPLVVRNNLTTQQKILLFVYVALKRAGR